MKTEAMRPVILLAALLPVVGVTAVAGIVSTNDEERPCVTGFTQGFTGGPTHLTVGPDGNLWVNEGQADLIARFDLGEKEATAEYPVPRGTELHDLVQGPDGNLWFSGRSDAHALGRLDIQTGEVTTFPGVEGGGQPHLWWAPDGYLYFAEVDAGRLARFDPDTGTITSSAYNLPPGSGIHSFVELPDGSSWWGLQDSDQLARFNLEQQRFDKFVDLPKGKGPHWLVHVPSDNAIWIAFAYSNELGRYDLETGEVTIFKTPLDPVTPEQFKGTEFFPTLTQMVADRRGNALWIATLSGGKILRFDLKTHELTEITCGLGFGGVTITIENDPFGNLWVTEPATGGLGRIDR
jgi:streptogramin lyase